MKLLCRLLGHKPVLIARRGMVTQTVQDRFQRVTIAHSVRKACKRGDWEYKL